jgi:hypothetical protein
VLNLRWTGVTITGGILSQLVGAAPRRRCVEPRHADGHQQYLQGNSADRDGGGIYNSSGTLTVRNSTFSGNASRDGGGIFTTGGTLTVTNSTLYGNTASSSGGGLRVATAAARCCTIRSSPAIGNDARQRHQRHGRRRQFLQPDRHRRQRRAGPRDNGNIVGIDPALVLEPLLWDNGGTSLTHALIAGSPAIDAGDPNFDPNAFTRR